MSLLTADYDYPLPEDLIATHPPRERGDARMLVLHRDSGTWEHRGFADFETFLRPGDLAVLNDTKVIPARVYSDDGRMELLLLEPDGVTRWRCMVRPGRKLRVGARFVAGGNAGVVVGVFEDGDRLIEFERPLDLDAVGVLPLPPYFRREAGEEDRVRYQTVFARAGGSVAAPTAGLHFTGPLLSRVPHAFVTLHVGAGTFKPVQADTLEGHPMHSERYEVPQEAAVRIAAAKRVLAVGTTSMRVLESCALQQGGLAAGEGRTSLFIHPPYSFRVAGALLTNFHLPKSTLLMLVSAFAGREFVLEAYREAVREKYRFYSYGDCMLVI